MSLIEDLPVARRAVRVRYRLEMDTLDRSRLAGELTREGATQRDIARLLGLSQPAVHKLLARTADAPEPVAGFSGATPLEICKRYGAGDLSLAEVVDQLSRFPYTPTAAPSAWDDLVVDPPGAWSELATAQGLGLIDDSIYRDVFLARHPEYAEEYAAEIAEEEAGGRSVDPGADQLVAQTSEAQTTAQVAAQAGPSASAGDGQSAAPRT